jgi:single-strand DNA-binding protein
MRAVVWGPHAEHVAESFQRGSRVIAHGRVSQRSYETSEGDKRTDVELVVDEFGGSARYATLRVSKASRSAEERMRARIRGRPRGVAASPRGPQPGE